MDQILFWLVPAASIMALCFAWYFHRQMMKESEGTPQMIKIAAAVRKGNLAHDGLVGLYGHVHQTAHHAAGGINLGEVDICMNTKVGM